TRDLGGVQPVVRVEKLHPLTTSCAPAFVAGGTRPRWRSIAKYRVGRASAVENCCGRCRRSIGAALVDPNDLDRVFWIGLCDDRRQRLCDPRLGVECRNHDSDGRIHPRRLVLIVEINRDFMTEAGQTAPSGGGGTSLLERRPRRQVWRESCTCHREPWY